MPRATVGWGVWFVLHFERFDDALRHYASRTPRAPATWFEGTQRTYAELDRDVEQFAASLVASGVLKGDRVAVLSTPRPEYWVAFLAILRVGAIYVGVNPAYTLREQLHVIGRSEPSMIFAISSFEGRSYASDVAALMDACATLREAFLLDDGPATDPLRRRDEFLARRSAQDFPAVAAMDPAAIIFTSGSSGAPKAALLPHATLAYGAHCDADQLLVKRPRVPCNLPTNHLACLVDVCGATLVVGGMLAFSERFDPATMLALIEDLQLTNLLHVPTVLQLVALHPDFASRDLSSLEVVAWGGASLPIDFVRVYHDRGIRLLTVYGQTETCANVSYSRPGDSLECLATTVGHPNPDADVRLVAEDGEDVAVGEEGEVWYRHPAVMLGYFRDPDATARTITPDGFVRTGDVARRLEDGTLVLVGRRSDMFKSGGFNVYPREIELVLESRPDVALAAVVGVADERYGEVGAAFVVLHQGFTSGSDEILSWCRDQLAGYKVPKSLTIREDLPFLPVGKVDKSALRDLARAPSR